MSECLNNASPYLQRQHGPSGRGLLLTGHFAIRTHGLCACLRPSLLKAGASDRDEPMTHQLIDQIAMVTFQSRSRVASAAEAFSPSDPTALARRQWNVALVQHDEQP